MPSLDSFEEIWFWRVMRRGGILWLGRVLLRGNSLRPGFVVALLVASAASATRVAAQEPVIAIPSAVPAYRHRLLGVFDGASGEPLEGVRVMDMVNKVTALTTRTGTVSLVFLDEGPNMVRVEKIGYQGRTIGVQISADDTVPITVLLNPMVNTLPTVVTRDSSPNYLSANLRAFEERRRNGIGHFVAEAELRKHDTEKMTSIIRRFGNLAMVCPTAGPRRGECWAESVRHAGKHVLQNDGCPLDVWLDGVNVVDDNLNGMAVSDFAGVEFYAGGATLPPQYNKTGSSCGVLLLWTRER